MDFVAVIILEVLYAIASLALISAGLAVVFGMMRVINLAHGEFLMLGGYAAIVSVRAGLNIYVAMLVVAPLVVGIIGLIIERCVIQFLYGRMLDTMLATWGLSLLLTGVVTMIFGNTTTGISTPIGGFAIGSYQASGYNIFIMLAGIAVIAVIFTVLKTTRLGLIARGAMQSADMASGLGHNPKRIYMVTFTLGAALSGLAGGILAPLTGLTPTSGGLYVSKAFITVISGGAAVVTGTVSSSALFGTLTQLTMLLSTPVWGDVAMLFAAIVLLRLLPRGITGRFFRRQV
ncbi:MAG: branched-chain amino acid ABC transporter permease [Ferrovibrio sp.]|uniref:branched-chain amino acid ABC transporter permease n=1 Tax=Ferrovibrio sp. TaxID=1917215 RepID=UPI002617391E|nr:branched-chain amino acid ABC transporter permease [Ferrovibrio sp.]MCW0234985.1 branched-chain amino acid ABC transporter permease [Ferrovibrio sp.]